MWDQRLFSYTFSSIFTLLACLVSHLLPISLDPPKELTKVKYLMSPKGRGTLLLLLCSSAFESMAHGQQYCANPHPRR
jgi:hypothetical protein